MTAFANLFVCNSRGQLRDVTLDISVELFSKAKNPIADATRRDALVQR
ncbi:hypothetical protein [Paraburkholderia sp. BL10I2N1]|nr:hypothetical protein [Paraburkholderia sp. BL10I2N1]